MHTKTSLSSAEILDKFIQLTAFLMLLTCLVFAVSASTFIAGEAVAGYLNLLEKGLEVLVILTLVPMFFLIFRKMSLQDEASTADSDSFTHAVVRQSLSISFLVTLVCVVLLSMLSEGYLATQPLEFFMDVMKAIMTGVFSISFFALNWRINQASSDAA